MMARMDAGTSSKQRLTPEARRWLRLACVVAVPALVLGGLSIYGLVHRWEFALALADERPPVEAYAKWGTWMAGTINAGLLLIVVTFAVVRATMALSKGRNGMADEVADVSGDVLARKRVPSVTRREWMWLLIVIVAALALRWPRMGLSFYNDEAHTFKRYIAGRFHEAKDGKVKFRQVSWLDTVWLNQVGNNLMPCSVFGRACYDSWRKLAHATEGTVCEAAVRLPQLVTGLASLVVLWLALRRLLGAGAAWWAVVLLALHPWHVRYCTEARAYGFMLLGVAMCFYFVIRALEDTRWRWWIGLGLAQFVCLWSFTGSVYLLAVFDAAVFVPLLWRAWKHGGSWVPLLRFGTGLIIGAMVTLQVMLPSVLPLLGAMRELDSLKGAMDGRWFADMLAGLSFGVRGVDWDSQNPDNFSLQRLLGVNPWLWLVIVASGALWLCGALLSLPRGRGLRLFVWSGPVAIALSWVVMTVAGKYLHSWYVIYALPGVVVALAFAVHAVASRTGPGMATRVLVFLPLAAVLGCWLWADFYCAQRGKENLRGLAEAARGESYPALLKAGGKSVFAAMLSDADTYDPRVTVLREAKDLDGALERARAAGVPLMVSVGRVGIGESELLLKRLTESGEFEPAAVIRGQDEEQFTHHLFQLRQSAR